MMADLQQPVFPADLAAAMGIQIKTLGRMIKNGSVPPPDVRLTEGPDRHDWRSVGSTWANEAGYSPDAIERQLAHAPDDRTRAVYNKAEYLDIRRQMLQDWADWLMPDDSDF